MIRRLIVLFSFSIALASCKKSSDDNCQYQETSVVVPASEIADLQTYVSANHPAAVQHPIGFFYEILAPGTGTVTPTVCSSISVKYVGYLTNGFKFDENTTGTTFPLGGLIVGWQKGVPLIKAGGSINLYLPPSLGWGSNPNGNIPANSITVFNVELVAVQ